MQPDTFDRRNHPGIPVVAIGQGDTQLCIYNRGGSLVELLPQASSTPPRVMRCAPVAPLPTDYPELARSALRALWHVAAWLMVVGAILLLTIVFVFCVLVATVVLFAGELVDLRK